MPENTNSPAPVLSLYDIGAVLRRAIPLPETRLYPISPSKELTVADLLTTF